MVTRRWARWSTPGRTLTRRRRPRTVCCGSVSRLWGSNSRRSSRSSWVQALRTAFWGWRLRTSTRCRRCSCGSASDPPTRLPSSALHAKSRRSFSTDPPASPGSLAGDPSRRRSWRIGQRSWTSGWSSRAWRSWRYEKAVEGGRGRSRAVEEASRPAPRARPRPLGGQRRHRERRADRAQARILSRPRETGDRGPRRAALQGDDHGHGRALRAAEPHGAELPAARSARRRRDHFAQDRRPGEGAVHGVAAHGDRGGAMSETERVLLVVQGGVLTVTLNR